MASEYQYIEDQTHAPALPSVGVKRGGRAPTTGKKGGTKQKAQPGNSTIWTMDKTLAEAEREEGREDCYKHIARPMRPAILYGMTPSQVRSAIEVDLPNAKDSLGRRQKNSTPVLHHRTISTGMPVADLTTKQGRTVEELRDYLTQRPAEFGSSVEPAEGWAWTRDYIWRAVDWQLKELPSTSSIVLHLDESMVHMHLLTRAPVGPHGEMVLTTIDPRDKARKAWEIANPEKAKTAKGTHEKLNIGTAARNDMRIRFNREVAGVMGQKLQSDTPRPKFESRRDLEYMRTLRRNNLTVTLERDIAVGEAASAKAVAAKAKKERDEAKAKADQAAEAKIKAELRAEAARHRLVDQAKRAELRARKRAQDEAADQDRATKLAAEVAEKSRQVDEWRRRAKDAEMANKRMAKDVKAKDQQISTLRALLQVAFDLAKALWRPRADKPEDELAIARKAEEGLGSYWDSTWLGRMVAFIRHRHGDYAPPPEKERLSRPSPLAMLDTIEKTSRSRTKTVERGLT
jgi:hypothetical protein